MPVLTETLHQLERPWQHDQPKRFRAVRILRGANGYMLSVEPTKDDPLGLAMPHPFVFTDFGALVTFLRDNLENGNNDKEGRTSF